MRGFRRRKGKWKMTALQFKKILKGREWKKKVLKAAWMLSSTQSTGVSPGQQPSEASSSVALDSSLKIPASDEAAAG